MLNCPLITICPPALPSCAVPFSARITPSIDAVKFTVDGSNPATDEIVALICCTLSAVTGAPSRGEMIVTFGVGTGVGVGDAVGVGEGVGDGDGVGEGDGVGDGVGVGGGVTNTL
jgi:hypothetical protein